MIAPISLAAARHVYIHQNQLRDLAKHQFDGFMPTCGFHDPVAEHIQLDAQKVPDIVGVIDDHEGLILAGVLMPNPRSLLNPYVPQLADEAMRDLSRAREDGKRAETRARQQLLALLLRHGLK